MATAVSWAQCALASLESSMSIAKITCAHKLVGGFKLAYSTITADLAVGILGTKRFRAVLASPTWVADTMRCVQQSTSSMSAAIVRALSEIVGIHNFALITTESLEAVALVVQLISGLIDECAHSCTVAELKFLASGISSSIVDLTVLPLITTQTLTLFTTAISLVAIDTRVGDH